MAPQSFGESLVGCYIRGDLLPSVGQLTADDRRQHRSTSASHKDSNDGCQYMGCLPPPTHGRSGDSSGSPPSGRPAEPTGADAPTSTSGDDTRFGPVEAAVRRFVEWHRTQNGATTTFGIVWFLFAG